MKKSVFVVSLVFLAGAAFGVIASNIPRVSAYDSPLSVNPADVTFVVSIVEVAQTFEFGEWFTGSYEKTVTMSDGSTREIILTPTEKDGQLWVEFQDGEGHTYMGPNGWTQNGNLLVSLRNYDQIGPSQNE